MGFSDENKILIKILHDSKGYGTKTTNESFQKKVGAKVDCNAA